MNRRKIALILSLIFIFSGNDAMVINAEDIVEFEDGFEIEEEGENDNQQISVEMSEIDDGQGAQTEKFEEPFITENKEEISDIGDGFEDDFSSGEELNNAREKEALNIQEDNEKYNLKNFSGVIENSSVFLGDNPSNTLEVFCLKNGVNVTLDKSNYTIVGYVTEEEYNKAQNTLDNINSFKTAPDTTGKWFLVFEGITPYYGRQAVCITVHDSYDLSMYNWSVDSDILTGENPAESLQVFMENTTGRYYLNKEDYKVLGYISEETYAVAGYNSDNISEFDDLPKETGTCLVVIEGVGDYHGRMAGYITVKDRYDLGMYQCNMIEQELQLGDDIQDFIKIERSKYKNSEGISKENYKILGYIKEKDFIASGYDINNLITIQDSVDMAGSWYVIIEANAPYYGRTAAWFNVKERKDEVELENSEVDED